MTQKRSKKSSVRRNTKAYKKVDPYWEENPNKLKNKQKKYKELQAKKPKNLASRNKRLREIAIKSLVKKNGEEENEKFFKEQEESEKNRTRYVKEPGESDRQFKQRMQDDVDITIAEAQMSKKMKKKNSVQSIKGTSNNEFRQLIRSELIDQGKIKARKYDLLDKSKTVKNAKQFQNEVKKINKNVKNLDKELDKQEKDLFVDKVEFGERNDDIFRSKALPKSVKVKMAKEKLLGLDSGKNKKKNNGLQFLSSQSKKNVDGSDSLYKRRMMEEERQKAILGYRELKGSKK